jgi:ribulose-5-phosphate 4-epimerase/fuculose-1-phosphate aldolase
VRSAANRAISHAFLHVAMHDFEGIADNKDECPRLVADLGSYNAMILRNHGLLVCGASVGAAFVDMWRMERACRTQIMALSCNTKLVFPPPEVSEMTFERVNGKRTRAAGQMVGVSPWPALLRKLDAIAPDYRD